MKITLTPFDGCGHFHCILYFCVSLSSTCFGFIAPFSGNKKPYYYPCDIPRRNCSEPVEITAHLEIWQIRELNVRNELLQMIGEIQLFWKDDFLSWNDTDMDSMQGMDIMRTEMTRIWYPDISVYYHMSNRHVYVYESLLLSRALVRRDGLVNVGSPVTISVSCPIDIRTFPFDYQQCKITLTSWSFDISRLRLKPRYKSAGIKNLIKNSELELISTCTVRHQEKYSFDAFTKNLSEVGYSYWDDAEFRLIFKRLPLYYVIHFLIPCVVLELGAVFAFLLPASCGDKISYSVSLLLSSCVLLLVLTEQLPVNSRVVPFLAMYFTKSIIMNTVIIFISACNLSLYHNCTRYSVASRGLLVKCICSVVIKFYTYRISTLLPSAGEVRYNSPHTNCEVRNHVAHQEVPSKISDTKLTVDGALLMHDLNADCISTTDYNINAEMEPDDDFVPDNKTAAILIDRFFFLFMLSLHLLWTFAIIFAYQLLEESTVYIEGCKQSV